MAHKKNFARGNNGRRAHGKEAPVPIDALNSVCPYYTMYPLSFPLGVLQRIQRQGTWVLDPFCGRGTTNFAARILGLPSVGIDASPIAVAIAKSKLVVAEAREVVAAAKRLIARARNVSMPEGKFWQLAYHPDTLVDLACLRAELMNARDNPAYTVLRAIVLGALHGPVSKKVPSYFSNQCPRSFSPKPDYAVRYWKSQNLKPRKVDVLAVIQTRAQRYLRNLPVQTCGGILLEDSRQIDAYKFGRRFG